MTAALQRSFSLDGKRLDFSARTFPAGENALEQESPTPDQIAALHKVIAQAQLMATSLSYESVAGLANMLRSISGLRQALAGAQSATVHAAVSILHDDLNALKSANPNNPQLALALSALKECVPEKTKNGRIVRMAVVRDSKVIPSVSAARPAIDRGMAGTRIILFNKAALQSVRAAERPVPFIPSPSNRPIVTGEVVLSALAKPEPKEKTFRAKAAIGKTDPRLWESTSLDSVGVKSPVTILPNRKNGHAVAAQLKRDPAHSKTVEPVLVQPVGGKVVGASAIADRTIPLGAGRQSAVSKAVIDGRPEGRKTSPAASMAAERVAARLNASTAADKKMDPVFSAAFSSANQSEATPPGYGGVTTTMSEREAPAIMAREAVTPVSTVVRPVAKAARELQAGTAEPPAAQMRHEEKKKNAASNHHTVVTNQETQTAAPVVAQHTGAADANNVVKKEKTVPLFAGDMRLNAMTGAAPAVSPVATPLSQTAGSSTRAWPVQAPSVAAKTEKPRANVQTTETSLSGEQRRRAETSRLWGKAEKPFIETSQAEVKKPASAPAGNAVKKTQGEFTRAAQGACAGCGGGNCAACMRPMSADTKNVNRRFATLTKGQ
ncbi:MAG: hypothetical protein KGI37_02815 [Alphaproteobacteria bacterium]|nr:hypothetical protein [Alphaproteobacteria bacterium]